MTRIKEIMSRGVASCHPDTPLAEVCQVMWDHDCGIVPVTEPGSERVVGIVTDRDAAMAGFTQDRPLSTIPVRIAMSEKVRACHEDDELATAHALMRERQIRRVAVTNSAGELTGLLSLNDMALHARASGKDGERKEVADTLAAVSRHRAPRPVTAHA